jgi:enoyl-CoA hydratase
VASARFGELAAAIEADGAAAVAGFAEPLPAFSLAGQRAVIDAAFSAPSVAEIVARLEADGGEFAAATLATLRAHSPSSVCWSFEVLRRGAGQNLPEALATELRLVRHVAMSAEFLEGVRAVVVDKDKSPKWQPATLEAVDLEKINEMFD